jgi:hypothetical protein
MARTTMRSINKKLEGFGVELVKGDGYFYFADLVGSQSYIAENLDSVYTMRVNDLTETQWVDYVSCSVAATKH